jgi:hypothetical protein
MIAGQEHPWYFGRVMESATSTTRDKGGLEKLAYRARWLFLLWIIGWWINFLYRLKVIDRLVTKISGMIQ